MDTKIEKSEIVEDMDHIDDNLEFDSLPEIDDVNIVEEPVKTTPSLVEQGQTIYAMPLGERKSVKTKDTRNKNDVLLLKGKISELEDERDDLIDRISILEAENAEMADELMIKPDIVRDGISQDDVRYLSNLLSSAGVPEILPDGTHMDIGDRIMFIVSQRSIMITGLQAIRSELTGIAHRARTRNPELSQELFDLLKRSSQNTNLIAVTEE